MLTVPRPDITDEQAITLAERTRGRCTICPPEHKGSLIVDGEIVDCECVKEFNRIRKLLAANIPLRYHKITLKDLDEKFVTENSDALKKISFYLSDIHNFVQNGTTLFISGPHGVAKTSISCILLRRALELGYKVGYVKLSELTNLIRMALSNDMDSEAFEWVHNSLDFLVIDEFEKEYKTSNTDSYTGLQFGSLINDLYNAQKSVIIVSNAKFEELKDIHTSDVIDRISSFTEFIALEGPSYRERANKSKGAKKK